MFDTSVVKTSHDVSVKTAVSMMTALQMTVRMDPRGSLLVDIILRLTVTGIIPRIVKVNPCHRQS